MGPPLKDPPSKPCILSGPAAGHPGGDSGGDPTETVTAAPCGAAFSCQRPVAAKGEGNFRVAHRKALRKRGIARTKGPRGPGASRARCVGRQRPELESPPQRSARRGPGQDSRELDRKSQAHRRSPVEARDRTPAGCRAGADGGAGARRLEGRARARRDQELWPGSRRKGLGRIRKRSVTASVTPLRRHSSSGP